MLTAPPRYVYMRSPTQSGHGMASFSAVTRVRRPLFYVFGVCFCQDTLFMQVFNYAAEFFFAPYSREIKPEYRRVILWWNASNKYEMRKCDGIDFYLVRISYYIHMFVNSFANVIRNLSAQQICKCTRNCDFLLEGISLRQPLRSMRLQTSE